MKQYELADISDRDGDLKKDWYVRYRYLIPGTINYKTFRQKRGINRFHTKADRMAAARIVRDEIDQMLKDGFNPFDNGSMKSTGAAMTFGDAKKYFYDNHISKLGQRSKERYNSTMGQIEEVIGGTMPLLSVRSNNIRSALNSLQAQRNWGNRSWNNALETISSMFAFLTNDEEIALKENPCRFIKDLPKQAPIQNNPATEREFSEVVRHLQKNNSRLLLAAAMVLYLSMRTSELGKVKRKQIVEYMGKPAFELYGSDVKNKMSRMMNVPDDLMRLFREQGILEIPPEYYIFSRDLVPGSKMLPAFRNRICEEWKIAVKDELKIDVSLYSFKHYGASYMMRHGVDEKLIQKWCDHQDLKTTNSYLRGSRPLTSINLTDQMVRLPLQGASLDTSQ